MLFLLYMNEAEPKNRKTCQIKFRKTEDFFDKFKKNFFVFENGDQIF